MNQRLKGAMIYLAGGIQYLPDLGMGWRQKAEIELRKLGIGVLNPLDKACNFANEDKDTQAYLKGQLIKLKLEVQKKEGNGKELCEEISEIMRGIVRADLRMVDLSTALLVHIDPTKHTAGTPAEMTQAFLQRKPVICWCEQGIEAVPLWWWGHGDYRLFFDSLERALEYIRHIHQDNEIEHLKRWKFFDYEKIYGKN